MFNPIHISRNPRYVAVLPARKVDLSGRIALHTGKGNVGSGPGEVVDFFLGAQLSAGGRTIFALPSRDRRGESNLLTSVREYPNQFSLWESVGMIVTEYGVVSLAGRTVRERAQALIDIAHPDDRAELVEQAKKQRIIYPDQIFLPESGRFYPEDIATSRSFGSGTQVRFRAIKPSDEEGMRRLFYRFSEKSVYYRYFTSIPSMPHSKIQEYTNVDYSQVLSVVGLVGDPGEGRIIAEGRFCKDPDSDHSAELALVVDEAYQNLGIASFLCRYLARLAKERGITSFNGYVQASNRTMMRVIEKGDWEVQASLVQGAYKLVMDLSPM